MAGRVQVLMPMGGLGSRFAKEDYTTPKPLIEVDGMPMFMRALQSFRPLTNVDYLFVIRKEHDAAYDLANQIRSQLPAAKITLLDHDTEGAVETCLEARDLIDDAVPIILADCDIYFESAAYFEHVNSDPLPDGLLLTFEADDPRYSYVKTDDRGVAVATAEKVAISSHALLGGYFFKSGELFKRLATSFMQEGLEPSGLKEYYLSHLFNLLIQEKRRVEIAPVGVKHIFGTPEELNAYLAGTDAQ